jgi:hypothetical protein
LNVTECFQLDEAMHQITLDSQTTAKLYGLTGPVDFCDDQGHLLGRFVPYPSGIRPEDLEAEVSPAELRRRADQFQGRKLAELIAEWEKRK